MGKYFVELMGDDVRMFDIAVARFSGGIEPVQPQQVDDPSSTSSLESTEIARHQQGQTDGKSKASARRKRNQFCRARHVHRQRLLHQAGNAVAQDERRVLRVICRRGADDGGVRPTTQSIAETVDDIYGGA